MKSRTAHSTTFHPTKLNLAFLSRTRTSLWTQKSADCKLPCAEPQRFADFLQPQQTTSTKGGDENPEAKAEELIQRTSALLKAAQDALADVRSREPSDSRHRRSGPDVATAPADPQGSKVLGGRKPAPTTLSFAWESDEEDDDMDDGIPAIGSMAGSVSTQTFPGSNSSNSSSNRFSMGGGGVGGGGSSASPSGGGNFSSGPGAGSGSGNTGEFSGVVDSWFGGKVDTGPMELRPSAMKPSAKTPTTGIAVMERQDLPASMEFAPPSEAPLESGSASIFPADLALKFQSDVPVFAEQEDVKIPAGKPAQMDDTSFERTSGEEFGENGYWYRWTEIKGQDATGAVQWFERWWESSDWRGMKEMGAEKWGTNDRGDAWRETWRETIAVDAATGQPKVERTAHKWARAGTLREWEEKWDESYWSGGRTEKWADKWAREGGDIWHEKWGESYDGAGGCTKWTDRWAERPPGYGAEGLDKWGEKWEEKFKDGQGSKNGETWTESAGGHRYQRWWGENHFGDGYVQKIGHSTTGEHWDVTEQMDTYYNPIPHFGYDLALAHSPTLRNLPTLPRDDALELDTGGGGDGGGKGRGGGGGGRKGKSNKSTTV